MDIQRLELDRYISNGFEFAIQPGKLTLHLLQRMTLPKEQEELSICLRRLRGSLLTVAAFSGFLNLLMLSPSLYMMQVYDRVLGSRNETTLLVLTALLLGIYIFMNALEIVRTWILVRVGARFDGALSERVFDVTFEQCLKSASTNATQPMHDLNTVRQTLTGSALLTLFDAPWVPIYLVAVSLISWELGIFTLGGMAMLSVLAYLNERISNRKIVEAQSLSAQSQFAISNSLKNSEVIASMGMLGNLRRRWHAVHYLQIRIQAEASDQAAVMTGLSKFVRTSMQSLALGFGALLVLEGRMSPGAMIAVSILVSRALAPVEQLVGNWKQIITGREAFKRIAALLSAHPKKTVATTLPPPSGGISLQDASATAQTSTKIILKGLNLHFSAGDCVAIVGPSGSGKSTLARLIVGAWPASTGFVRLDGATLDQWNRDDLGSFLGYLPQDIELFEGTVAENIARFGPIDSEKIVKAAKSTKIHQFILGLPQGYDSQIGVGGCTLSGGQKQRLGLARAIYGDPALLVLDEPNSNLDEQGENALLEVIKEFTARGKTTVFITHKMSTIAVAHKILVLVDGQVRTYGPREEVISAVKTSGKTATADTGSTLPTES